MKKKAYEQLIIPPLPADFTAKEPIVRSELIEAEVLAITLYNHLTLLPMLRVFLDRKKMDYATLVIGKTNRHGKPLWTGSLFDTATSTHCDTGNIYQYHFFTKLDQSLISEFLSNHDSSWHTDKLACVTNFQNSANAQKIDAKRLKIFNQTQKEMDGFSELPDGFQHWIDHELFTGLGNRRKRKEFYKTACLNRIGNQFMIRYFENNRLYDINAETKEHEITRETSAEIMRFVFDDQFKVFTKYEWLYNYDHPNGYWKKREGLGDNCLHYRLFPHNLKAVLADSAFTYSAIDILVNQGIEFNPLNYLLCYSRKPLLEYLVKGGLTNIALDVAHGRFYLPAETFSARTLHDFLGIAKGDLNAVRATNPHLNTMEQYRQLKAVDATLSHTTIAWLESLKLDYSFGGLLKMAQSLSLSPVALIKYLKKQSKQNKMSSVNGITQYYTDYINMGRQFNYEFDQEHIVLPHDLMARHNQLVEQINLIKEEVRLKQLAEKDGLVQMREVPLNQAYHFEFNDLLICAPHNIAEFLREGRLLDHCVGGNTYIDNHLSGLSSILFIRKITQPDVPFVTLELTGKHVKQMQGFQNKGVPDEVKAFVDIWTKTIVKKASVKNVKLAPKEVINQMEAIAC